MRLVVRPDHDQALQLNVPGERNVEQQLRIAVAAVHVPVEVQALRVRLEDDAAAALFVLVQALQMHHVDLLEQTVLDAQLGGVVDVGGLVLAAAVATVIVTVRHLRVVRVVLTIYLRIGFFCLLRC